MEVNTHAKPAWRKSRDGLFVEVSGLPAPVVGGSVLFGLLLIGIVIGAAMQESRHQFLRGLGFLLTALLLVLGGGFTSVIPRWGSAVSIDGLGEWPRRIRAHPGRSRSAPRGDCVPGPSTSTGEGVS